MEEAIKNRIIVILSLLTIILFISTINASLNSRRLNKELTNQKDIRFELEKKADFAFKEQTRLEEEKKSLSREKESLSIQIAEEKKEFERLKKESEQLKKDLHAEKLMTGALKNELEKMTRLKEQLEENLKEALMIRPRKRR